MLTRGFSQLYLSLGDAGEDGAIAVRLYHKPLVLLIWLGAVVMVIGGALSLSDRRLRVGAPRRRGSQNCSRRSERCGLLASSVAIIVACCIGTPLHAVQPDEILPDAKLEERARNLSRELRCMVCQNQSIDDSDAPLARDLRLLVRERLKAGDSDRQVMDFLTARYGDFVLLNPPLNAKTFLLWVLPAGLLVLGGIVLVLAMRRRAAVLQRIRKAYR